jgi:hypothetical protein
MDENEAPNTKSAICRDWDRGYCYRGSECKFAHGDYQVTSSHSPQDIQLRGRPLPRQICWQWLRGKCDRGYLCEYRHADVDYSQVYISVSTSGDHCFSILSLPTAEHIG